MFPETDLSKIGNTLMLVMAGGVLYHVKNASEPDHNNCLIYSPTLRFPLSKSETLADMENRYLKKNQKAILDFKQEQINSITGRNIAELEKIASEKEDIMFFFREICTKYNLQFPEFNTERQSQKYLPEPFKRNQIFTEILNCDYAIINRRIFLLTPSDGVCEVFICGKNYKMSSSQIKIEDLEKDLQKGLQRELKREAAYDFEMSKKNSEKILRLEEQIGSIEVIVGVSKHQNAYEFGDIGYDFSSKLVYWLIPEHNNGTTGKYYRYGESAITVPLENKKLGSSVRFAERDSLDSPFRICSQSNCYGGATSMPAFQENSNDPIEDIMYTLKTCVAMVKDEGRFYTPPNNYSSSDSYSSSDDSYNYGY